MPDIHSAFPPDSHRGGFGEHGGEERGFIDRSFREKIIIVGLDTGDEKDLSIAAQMTELERLVSTAGADVVHHLVQKRESPDPATFIGRGKVQEIYELAELYDIDTVVFNDELSPAQQNNLEKAFKRSAIDRTAVILDIFAQNASTPEGKAQVELAQLQYLLPRLRGRGIALSQQGGGIGTRGPGETKLEVDRRRLVRKVHYLQKQLNGIRLARKNQSKRRRKSVNQSIAIVGYTNAGKSSLLNALCDRGQGRSVEAKNSLFATLDPTTRRLCLPRSGSAPRELLITDTVGFIRELPEPLIQAFMATLEETREADRLLLVVDLGDPDWRGQLTAVHSILNGLNCHQPRQVLANQIDRCDASTLELIRNLECDVLYVSATQGTGLKGLRAWLEQTFWGASPSPVTPGLAHRNSAEADA